jgi:FkbM family methyltransferase
MIKTAANIIKGALRKRKPHNFRKIPWMREKILKHTEDRKVKHLKLGGFDIDYRRPYELLHTYRDIFENEIYRFTAVSKKPLIIDCGSNIGLSILYFKLVYPESKVIAFEPDAGNFELLQKNVGSNRLNDVELHYAAVWTIDGMISFESNASEASHISQEGNGQKVKAISLNKILSGVASVDFLKIDIEGAEWDVIRDCRGNLPKVKNLFLEYHGKVNDTRKLNDLLDILHETGFMVYVRNAADNLDHPFVEKRTNTPYDVQLNLFCYK